MKAFPQTTEIVVPEGSASAADFGLMWPAEEMIFIFNNYIFIFSQSCGVELEDLYVVVSF